MKIEEKLFLNTNRKVPQEAGNSSAIDYKFTNKYTHTHVDIFAPNTLSSLKNFIYFLYTFIHILYTCYILHKFRHTQTLHS